MEALKERAGLGMGRGDRIVDTLSAHGTPVVARASACMHPCRHDQGMLALCACMQTCMHVP